jgi:prophage maintenance system killer protein
MNHPFMDGNKRTGLAAALVFLDFNGVEIEDPVLASFFKRLSKKKT